MRLAINERFRRRRVTGVERYATELADRLPGTLRRFAPAHAERPPLGHMWEQFVLPAKVAKDEVLWSPCNTGPISLRRQMVTIHDIAPIDHPEWYSPNYARWIAFLTRKLAKHSMRIVTDSEFTRRRLGDRLGIEPDKVSIVRLGVDERFITGTTKLTPGERDALGIGDRPYLLSVATHEPRKNLESLMRAFARVREREPDVVLAIAGNSARRDIFAEGGNAEISGERDRVVFLGYVPDEQLPAVYGSAEALVYVPHYEGFGLPPIEAAAAGTRLVLSDIAALHELGLPATWVDPDEVESIAEGILETLQNGSGADHTELVAAATRFSWGSAVDQLRDAAALCGAASD